MPVVLEALYAVGFDGDQQGSEPSESWNGFQEDGVWVLLCLLFDELIDGFLLLVEEEQALERLLDYRIRRAFDKLERSCLVLVGEEVFWGGKALFE